jgi:biotin carboxyl carrier protein
MILDVSINGADHRVVLQRQDDGTWKCELNGQEVIADLARTGENVLSLLIAGQSYEVISNPSQQQIVVAGKPYSVEVRDPRSWRARRAAGAGEKGPKNVVAPMPGKVVRIVAPPGTEVERGSGVVVIEAMKMQNELKSPKKGKVARVLATEGATVNAGDVLAVIE